MDSQLARKIAIENYKSQYENLIDANEHKFKKLFEKELMSAVSKGYISFQVSYSIPDDDTRYQLARYKGMTMALSHFKNLGYICTYRREITINDDGERRKIFTFGFSL